MRRLVLSSLLFALFAARILAAEAAPAAPANAIACKASGHPPGMTGVVMLHGRQGGATPGSPPGSGDYFLAPERKKIESTGFRVVEPDLPWSMSRALDRSFEESLDEVAAAIDAVKKKGAKRIVLDGFSMGANAALGYAALRGGVDAVIVVSPGLVPEYPGYERALAKTVARARASVAAGQGDLIDMYRDGAVWNGTVITTPSRLLSYYDVNGEELMSKNVLGLKPGVPLLWIVGQNDQMGFALGSGYAFDKAPPNRINRYIVIPDGEHVTTPRLSADIVVRWLKCL
jgi:pimeloyl-ACP methyl ester carboxylesterase